MRRGAITSYVSRDEVSEVSAGKLAGVLVWVSSNKWKSEDGETSSVDWTGWSEPCPSRKVARRLAQPQSADEGGDLGGATQHDAILHTSRVAVSGYGSKLWQAEYSAFSGACMGSFFFSSTIWQIVLHQHCGTYWVRRGFALAS
jgi:hypothetical protein